MWVEETSYDPMIRHTCGSAIFMLYSHSSMRGLAGWVMLKKNQSSYVSITNED